MGRHAAQVTEGPRRATAAEGERAARELALRAEVDRLRAATGSQTAAEPPSGPWDLVIASDCVFATDRPLLRALSRTVRDLLSSSQPPRVILTIVHRQRGPPLQSPTFATDTKGLKAIELAEGRVLTILDPEGVTYTPVEFQDNEGCIELLEKPPNGILRLLDSQCKTPKATDMKFCTSIYDEHAKPGKVHAHLVVPERRPREAGEITVKHSPGTARYASEKILGGKKHK